MQILKRIFRIQFLIVFVLFLGTIFFFTGSMEKSQSPKMATSYATREVIQNNVDLGTPIICNYEIDPTTSEVFQDCSNLLQTQQIQVVAELNIAGHFKMGNIEFYDQNQNQITNAKVVGFSMIPYSLLQNYSNECSTYCYPSRLFFQFTIPNNRQILGIRLKGFRFKNKLQQSALTNYDPTKIKIKLIRVGSKATTYSQLREQLSDAENENVFIDDSVNTPASANQGLPSVDLMGVDVNIDFFTSNSNIEKVTFNLLHHSLTLNECRDNLIPELVRGLNKDKVCEYLVFQRDLANRFGNAAFVISINTVNFPSKNTSLDINITGESFFENYLLGYKSINFEILSTAILNAEEWKIFSLFHLAQTNQILESFRFKADDLNEAFLIDLFDLPNIKSFQSLDISNNHITLTNQFSNLLNRFEVGNLNLSENQIDNTFVLNSLDTTLHSLNVKNTNWEQVTQATLWQNVPNIKEIILAGTNINTISLSDFINLLPNPDEIEVIEADFSDTQSLKIRDFYENFPNLKVLNVPLQNYEISDIDKFIQDVKGFAGKIGLPKKGTVFLNTTPEKVFDAAKELKNKIVDLDRNEISLYYDLYLSFLFQSYLKDKDFFKHAYVQEHLNEVIDEIIGSYRILFNSSNIAYNYEDNFQLLHDRTMASFPVMASLIEANIKGKLISTFIEENEQITKGFNLKTAPDELYIKHLVTIMILVTLMFASISCIVLVIFFRFIK